VLGIARLWLALARTIILAPSIPPPRASQRTRIQVFRLAGRAVGAAARDIGYGRILGKDAVPEEFYAGGARHSGVSRPSRAKAMACRLGVYSHDPHQTFFPLAHAVLFGRCLGDGVGAANNRAMGAFKPLCF